MGWCRFNLVFYTAFLAGSSFLFILVILFCDEVIDLFLDFVNFGEFYDLCVLLFLEGFKFSFDAFLFFGVGGLPQYGS